MKDRIRFFIPLWARPYGRWLVSLPERILPPIFEVSNLSASIFYSFLNSGFSREHRAVLSGRVAYRNKLNNIGESSVLLRRNIHRIEKGLVMRPRRRVFADSYIEEVVEVYKSALKSEDWDAGEKKWVTDVLLEYFSVVGNNKKISAARAAFLDCSLPESESLKHIPYSAENLPNVEITYDQLRKLCIRRRSVRWFQERHVPQCYVDKAVDLAALAPSACNRQPFSFFVSESAEMAVEMAQCAGGTSGWVHGIPCTIAVVGDLSAYARERDRHLIYIDGSLAAMQLMLAFQTMGLASCSINWPDVENDEKKLARLLGLKRYERPIMLVAVGFPDSTGGIPYSQKKTSSQLVKMVRK